MDPVASGHRSLSSPERYFSHEAAELERERLWPRVWLLACREEQLTRPGDFVTFNIGGELMMVIRGEGGENKAFYNVCQHRGRRLKDGIGNTGKSIVCPFHGWTWNIDGSLKYAVDEEDYDGCPYFAHEDFGLQPLKLDTWAGWVFVSMDDDIEPLAQWLDPLPRIMKNFEFDKCRIAWHHTLIFPANWKTVINGFNENYHVATTHPQLNKFGLVKSPGVSHGIHSQFVVQSSGSMATASLLGTAANFRDMFETIEVRERERAETLKALISEYSLEASRQLRSRMPADAEPAEIVARYRELHREELEKAGAAWPVNLTHQDIAEAGTDWHCFPNFIILPSWDGALHYRIAPHPSDPEQSIMDVWWMQRFPPGQEPKIAHTVSTLEEFAGKNPFLEQDFANLLAVQRGMHSRGFRGAALNPVQEVPIMNFERVLDQYLGAASDG